MHAAPWSCPAQRYDIRMSVWCMNAVRRHEEVKEGPSNLGLCTVANWDPNKGERRHSMGWLHSLSLTATSNYRTISTESRCICLKPRVAAKSETIVMCREFDGLGSCTNGHTKHPSYNKSVFALCSKLPSLCGFINHPRV